MQSEIMNILEERLKLELGVHERQLTGFSSKVDDYLRQCGDLKEQLTRFDERSAAWEKEFQDLKLLLLSDGKSQRNWMKLVDGLRVELEKSLQRERSRDDEILHLKRSIEQLTQSVMLVNKQQSALNESVLSLIGQSPT